MNYLEFEDRLQNIVENIDSNEFIYEFLMLYGIAKSTISKLRSNTNNLSNQDGVKWLRNKILFKVAPKGKTLEIFANTQNELASTDATRFIFITDFTTIHAKDTKTHDTLDINFKDLPQHFNFFLPLMGVEKIDYDKENPLDQKAAQRFIRIYDELVLVNQNTDSKDLNLFLIRLLFCLFAEDTGIFDKTSFTDDIGRLSSSDGSNLNEVISSIFNKLSQKDYGGGRTPPGFINTHM